MRDDYFIIGLPILMCVLSIIILNTIVDHETSSSSTTNNQKAMYEQVKVDGARLYKVQLLCPDKTYMYLTTDSCVFDSHGAIEFTDYSSSFKVKSSCPAVCSSVIRKTEDVKLTKEQIEKTYLLNDQNVPIIDENKSLETNSKLPQSIIINNNNVQK